MTEPLIPIAALNQHVAVLGKTRSGKSSVMRGLVENLLEQKKPVCIIDPKGDWWGIKLSGDGKRPGYPVVIFGGEHADVPITAHAGAHVAEMFATENRPCLIDLGGWMVGERTRFYIDFASTLFRLTRGMRWLVIDEIHNFAPKGKIMDPDAGKALHWTNRLASEGLGKGLPMLFASQRPQKVHNDTLTSAETLVAMRVLHPSDRGAVADWIKGCGDVELGNKVLNSLAQMDRGEGWLWSPEIGLGPKRVKFPMFKTYDSFRPQSAEDTAALKGWATVDLDAVKAKLSTVVKEAQANDPKALRARIVELEREAKKGKPAAAPVPVVDTAASKRALENERRAGYTNGYDAATDRFNGLIDDLLGVVPGEVAKLASDRIADRFKRLRVDATRRIPPPKLQHAAAVPPTGHISVTEEFAKQITREVTGAGEIKSGQQKVLNALAELHAIGVHAPSRTQLGMFAGYNLSGGAGSKTVASLIEMELVEIPGTGTLTLTPTGHRNADFRNAPSTHAEIHERVLAKVSSGEQKILRHLIEIYPSAISRAQLGDAVDYNLSGGAGSKSVANLITVGAVRIPAVGAIVASDLLFPDGLA